MDMIERLRAWALASPRVLVVDAPGTRPMRWAVEAELDRRGWASALSPSDADVLVVVGTPGPELAAAVDLLWRQIPRPRHRVDLVSEEDVEEVLAAAPRALASAGEEADETVGDAEPAVPTDHSGHEGMAGMDDAPSDGMDHSGHEGMAGMDDAPSEGMDHSGHHMDHGGEVAGLPMAETAPDRDGLQLDVLRVSLGPVLPDWPTGLLLRAELQGDVVTGAELSWLDAGDHAGAAPPDADPRRTALDHLAALLSVAGWPTAARDVRRVRDLLGSPDPRERASAEQRGQRALRRVQRSRTLAWSLRDVGRLDAQEPDTGGDVLDRMRRWCAVASGGGAAAGPAVLPLEELASLLVGTEIAAARLLVASVQVQPMVTPAEPEAVSA